MKRFAVACCLLAAAGCAQGPQSRGAALSAPGALTVEYRNDPVGIAAGSQYMAAGALIGFAHPGFKGNRRVHPSGDKCRAGATGFHIDDLDIIRRHSVLFKQVV